MGEQLSKDVDENEKNFTAFHLFKHKYLDVWADPSYIMNKDEKDYQNKEELKFINEKMQKSKVIFSDPYLVAQILKIPSNTERLDQLNFLVHNKAILMIILIGYFLLLFTNFLLWPRFNRKFKKRKKLNLNVLETLLLNFKQLACLSFKIALVYLFFAFFRFINLSILGSNIKTESTIVKTDEFIDSVERLMNTKNSFLSHNYDSFIFSRAPNDSFLKKFFDKKLKEKRYLKVREFDLVPVEKIQSYFLFTTEITVSFSLSTLTPRLGDDVFIFLKQKIYYELLKVIYMRKDLEDYKKDHLNTRYVICEINYLR